MAIPIANSPWGALTISLAAVFLVKIHACRVKNARKIFNLAALFSLQARIFPQKTASQAECQHALGRLKEENCAFRRPLRRFLHNNARQQGADKQGEEKGGVD
ncbi:hypothetical protein CGZ77_01140 [Neisseria sp. KEM232]|nr:hypothetical protein CGZ77_01140 [Neisseria sp. KEM232]